MAEVLGAADALGFQALKDWSIPTIEDRVVDVVYTSFRRAVRRLCTEMQVRIGRRLKENSVAFDPETKKKLRTLLDQMREAVDTEPHLTPRKKDALYRKISALAAEVDSDWSRSESYGALVIEVAGIGGEAAHRLEPMRKLLEAIGGLWGKALRDRDDSPSLPAPKEQKRIEPPKRQKATYKYDKKLDDEIPF